MKYEMIFGDERLFDGYYDENVFIVIATSNGQKFVIGEFTEYGIVDCDIKSDGLRIAMRRIIKEPAKWTWEDKKAGRLPEVGAEVQFNFYQSAVMRQGVIKYIDDQVAVIQTEDVTRPFCYETCKVVFTPIETPEEKSERLRSEWVELAFDNMMRKEGLHSTECLDRIKCHFGSAYDALLSGTLSAPTKGGE